MIDHRLEIAAPVDIVWDVITDFDRYDEWNPFVVSCRSTLVVGDPIEMRAHIFRSFAQPQTESIFEHQPGHSFSYGLRDAPLGAVRSLRSHTVDAIEDGRTQYTSHFELGGWLSPVVRGLLGLQLRRGFGEMTAAIGSRAEKLAGA